MLEMMIKRKEMIENFKKYLKNINESIKAVLKDSEVFLFGSAITGEQFHPERIQLDGHWPGTHRYCCILRGTQLVIDGIYFFEPIAIFRFNSW